MLTNFFGLNEPYTIVETPERFSELLRVSKDLRNILYQPDSLRPDDKHPKYKIWDTKFTNVSFSKTHFEEVNFYNCQFEDCLFIGSSFESCEFHYCKFLNCNTHKISIENSYVNPGNFVNCLKGSDKANIGVHLFQQLLNNSINQGQSKHRRIADYNFRKWQDRLNWNKYWKGKPYQTRFWEFIRDYPISWIYRYTFGYGLRLRNFLLSFLVFFTGFYIVNYFNWKSYALSKKDISIESFDKDSVNIASNFYYTLDATTKIIDSQFQATNNYGINWLSFQSLIGLIFLSALITLIINRFVK